MKKDQCALLIHGFGGCTEEILSLYDFLNANGIPSFCIELPGHGSQQKNMKRTKRHQWINAVRTFYLEKSKEFDHIILIGFSMGGLISVHLADLNPCSIIFINTPVYYWNIKQIIKNLCLDFKNELCKYIRRSKGKPFRALIQFNCLLITTRKKFKDVMCPTLTIQTKDDDLVYPFSAKYIQKRVQRAKPVVWIDKGGHYILESKYAPILCNKLLDYIKAI